MSATTPRRPLAGNGYRLAMPGRAAESSLVEGRPRDDGLRGTTVSEGRKRPGRHPSNRDERDHRVPFAFLSGLAKLTVNPDRGEPAAGQRAAATGRASAHAAAVAEGPGR